MRLLVFLFTSATIIRCQDHDHKFSSSVGPCEDFDEFVCNKKVVNDPSTLALDYEGGFMRKLQVAMVKEKDPVLGLFSQLLSEIKENSEDDLNELVGIDYFVKNRPPIMTYREIQDYLNLIYIKYIIENDLIKRSRVEELLQVFDEVKSKIIEVVQSFEWMSNGLKTELVEHVRRETVVIGLPESVQNLTLVRNVLSAVQRRFFEFNKYEPISANCTEKCKLQRSSTLLSAAYKNVTVNDNGENIISLGNNEGRLDLAGVFWHTSNDEFIHKNGSRSMYLPPRYAFLHGPLPKGLRYGAAFYFARLFIASIEEKASMRFPCFDPEFGANRVVSSMLLKQDRSHHVRQSFTPIRIRSPLERKMKWERFTDVEWYFIGRKLQMCVWDHYALHLDEDFKTERDQLLLNPEFQKAFHCYPSSTQFSPELVELCYTDTIAVNEKEL
ncbi:hypothetical protein QR680_014530 [Steinernema hermaphroditum]|uniref:Peptidase M13 N-terminal domain-containing protein n=1 Tax=Steinernema hermaphroditum TaxID=289476 RepID=A0AA39I965_9BILA|nr:hypothetical protein QR680_014530 [Steinernema hermaphroditum]